MRYLIVLAAFFATAAVAHPNGTYIIDNQEDVTVTFEVIERCPTDVEGAMRGSLRTLTFSDAAEADPYLFFSGFYVETHNEEGEVYVQTDDNCVPVLAGEELPASRDTFAGYALRRVN